MLKLTALLTAPFLLLAIAAGATGVLLVEVREGGPDGTHIVVPVPLVLARGALAFVPDEANYIQCPDLERYGPVAVKALKAIRDARDGVLVEVRDGEELVLVRKEGNALLVDVHDGDSDVQCRVPLKAAIRMLESHDGCGFRTRDLVAALQGAPRGQLVHVRDGGDEVRIRIL